MPKAVLVPAVVIMLGAVGVGLFTVTKALIVAASPSSPAASPSLSSSPPASETCGSVMRTDADGYPIGRLEALVRSVHDAACRHDYAGLLPYMNAQFGAGEPKGEIVARWQARDPEGTLLDLLAETLETPAHGSQGGATYCHPGGAVAVFPRGTSESDSMWGDFDPSGDRLPGCEAA